MIAKSRVLEVASVLEGQRNEGDGEHDRDEVENEDTVEAAKNAVSVHELIVQVAAVSHNVARLKSLRQKRVWLAFDFGIFHRHLHALRNVTVPVLGVVKANDCARLVQFTGLLEEVRAIQLVQPLGACRKKFGLIFCETKYVKFIERKQKHHRKFISNH